MRLIAEFAICPKNIPLVPFKGGNAATPCVAALTIRGLRDAYKILRYLSNASQQIPPLKGARGMFFSPYVVPQCSSD
ncbi:MAG: hypothetical protein AMXMBFR82_34050 [Candidatus Hydrogenedentota bacterium]